MGDAGRDLKGGGPVDEYESPELVVHGTVADITRGAEGPDPDIGAAGSQLGDTENP
jgi:hypothetical protein